jgi:large subunit ribosomal protein L19e
MNLSSQKRIASKILKCGISRVKIKADKKVEDALTRNDIRELIKNGLITKIQKKGTSKFRTKKILKQKRKGRRKGMGSRKGTKHARSPAKSKWIKNIRSLRKLLRELRDSGQIEKTVYRKLYLRIKAGAFRNKKHLLFYLKDHELLKKKGK